MRNARSCGCSFSQNQNVSPCVGERVNVNQCNSYGDGCGNQPRRCGCQNTCRPKPCPPRPCPPRPCPPRPCPPRRPSCEDRCAAQYRNCMRNCRWENEEQGCGCGNHHGMRNDHYDEEYYDGENDYGCNEN